MHRGRLFITFALLISVLTALALAAGPASAQPPLVTFNVDTTADATDALPGDGACATAAAACSLRAAIEEAQALGGGNHYQINLPAGTYTLTLEAYPTGDANYALYGGTMLPVIDGRTITLTGAGWATTEIRRSDAAGPARLFLAFNANLSFDNLSFSNGVGASAAGCSNCIAGTFLYAEGGTLSLARARVSDFNATVFDGSSAVRAVSASSVSISRAAFHIGTGLGVEYHVSVRNTPDLSVTSTTFEGGKGLSVTTSGAGTNLVENSTFVVDVALDFVRLVGSANTELTMRNSTVLGGALIATNGATGTHAIRLIDSIVAHTQACDINTPGSAQFIGEGRNLVGLDGSLGGCPATPEFEAIAGAASTVIDTTLSSLPSSAFGGPTQVLHPANNSPAIDRALGTCPAQDGRGATRNIGAGCDIGAVEAIQATLTSNSPVNEGSSYSATITFTGSAQCLACPRTISTASSNGSAAAPGDYLPFTIMNLNVSGVGSLVMVQSVQDDDVVEGDETFTASVTSMTGFSILGPTTQVYTISANDGALAGVTVSETALTVEEGEGDTFSVVLDAAPGADVTVNLTAPGIASLNTAQLTFNEGNWDTPQVVTITGFEDSVDGPDSVSDTIGVTVSSALPAYNLGALPNINVTVTDDDTSAVVFDPAAVTVVESGSTIVNVALASQPGADVTVSLTPPAEVTFDVSLLTFTAADWDIPQAVTVSGIDNAVDAPDVVTTLAYDAASLDAKYDAVAGTAGLTVQDDDTAGVNVTPGALNLLEGTSATFNVGLTSQPTADVQIALTFDALDLDVQPSVLTLSDLTPQTITVTPLDDPVIDSETVDITFVASSVDGLYDGFVITPVSVQITDAQTNLLVNPSFESGGTRGAAPDGWTGSNLLASDSSSSKQVIDGARTFRFRFTGVINVTRKLKQTVGYDAAFAQAGDTLDFSIWARGKNLTNGGQVKLKVKYANGSKDKVTLGIGTGTTPYTELTANIPLTGPVAKVKVQIQTGSSGTLWVDASDLRITAAAPRRDAVLPLPSAPDSFRRND